MPDTTSSQRALPGVSFATVPVVKLHAGDLGPPRPLRRRAGRYVLVAQAALVDDLVHLVLYDSDSIMHARRPAGPTRG